MNSDELKGCDVESNEESVSDISASELIRELHWKDTIFSSVLRFLMIPGLFAIPVLLIGEGVPSIILYSFALFFGVALIIRSFGSIEYLMASFIFYIPLSKMMPISIAPMVNGTNIFILLLLALMFLRKKEQGDGLGQSNKLLIFFAVLTSLSGITALFAMGPQHIFGMYLLEYKSWVDQLIFILIFSKLISSRAMAVRMMGYMVFACLLVTVLGFQEALDKAGRATIDASRIEGPLLQPNNFAAFLVYSIGPILGLSLIWLKSSKILFVAAYLLIWLKVLLATFSRGAYLGFLCGCIAFSYVRGIRFSILMAVLAGSILLVFPQLLPDSIVDRFSSTRSDTSYETGGLDKSSHSRLIIWNAAIEITKESPILGKGFKVFPVIMEKYLEQEVEERDPHNMYFYMSTQMGIPAVILFIALMVQLYFRGRSVYSQYETPFIKAIGIGAVCTAIAVIVINVFGSRMVNLEVTAFVWLYSIVLAKLTDEKQRTISEDSGFS